MYTTHYACLSKIVSMLQLHTKSHKPEMGWLALFSISQNILTPQQEKAHIVMAMVAVPMPKLQSNYLP